MSEATNAAQAAMEDQARGAALSARVQSLAAGLAAPGRVHDLQLWHVAALAAILGLLPQQQISAMAQRIREAESLGDKQAAINGLWALLNGAIGGYLRRAEQIDRTLAQAQAADLAAGVTVKIVGCEASADQVVLTREQLVARDRETATGAIRRALNYSVN